MNGSFDVLIDLNKKHATLNLVLDFMKTHQNVILRSLIECTDNWWYKSVRSSVQNFINFIILDLT